MTKEQEAQQAQTIAEIRSRHATAYIKPTGEPCEYDGHIAFEQVKTLLEIVESQAQKIAELESQVKGYQVALDVEVHETETITARIAEHAKEIERLKAIHEDLESVKRMSSGVAGYHLNGEIATWDEVWL